MRRSVLIASLALTLIAASGALAVAGELATSTLYRGVGSEVLICVVTNVSSKTVTNVTISLAGETGDCDDLLPGTFCQASSAQPFGFCRVTFNGSASKVRAALSVNDLDNNIIAIEPAR